MRGEKIEAVIENINDFRKSAKKRVLWPDYEIGSWIQGATTTSDLIQFCNMDRVKHLSSPIEDESFLILYHEELLQDYTHVWVRAFGAFLDIFLSSRVIAVDSIEKNQSKWTIKVYHLKKEAQLWGIILKPYVIVGAEYRIITPQYIRKSGAVFHIEFETESKSFEEMVIIGRQTTPNYGRIYDENSLPPETFALFQMKIKTFPSFLLSTVKSEQEQQLKSFVPIENKKRGKLETIVNHFRPESQIISKCKVSKNYHRSQDSTSVLSVKSQQSNGMSKRRKVDTIERDGIKEKSTMKQLRRKQFLLYDNLVVETKKIKGKMEYKWSNQEGINELNRFIKQIQIDFEKISQDNTVLIEIKFKGFTVFIPKIICEFWGISFNTDKNLITIKPPCFFENFLIGEQTLKLFGEILKGKSSLISLESYKEEDLMMFSYFSMQLGIHSLAYIFSYELLEVRKCCNCWVQIFALIEGDSINQALEKLLMSYFEREWLQIYQEQCTFNRVFEKFGCSQLDQCLKNMINNETSSINRILLLEIYHQCVDIYPSIFQTVNMSSWKIQGQRKIYRKKFEPESRLMKSQTEFELLNITFSQVFQEIKSDEWRNVMIKESPLNQKLTKYDKYYFHFKEGQRALNNECMIFLPIITRDSGEKFRIILQPQYLSYLVYFEILGFETSCTQNRIDMKRYLSFRIFLNIQEKGIEVTCPSQSKTLIFLGSITTQEFSINILSNGLHEVLLHSVGLYLEYSLNENSKDDRRSGFHLPKRANSEKQKSEQTILKRLVLSLCEGEEDGSDRSDDGPKVFQLEEQILMTVLSSDYLSVSQQTLLLQLVSEYYQQEDKEKKRDGRLFKALRYHYIPNNYFFNIFLDNSSLLSFHHFRQILRSLILNAIVGRPIPEKNVNVNPRVKSNEYCIYNDFQLLGRLEQTDFFKQIARQYRESNKKLSD